MTKDEKLMKDWVDETHRFQRIDGIEETPQEQLEDDWLKMNDKNKMKSRCFLKTYQTIDKIKHAVDKN